MNRIEFFLEIVPSSENISLYTAKFLDTSPRTKAFSGLRDCVSMRTLLEGNVQFCSDWLDNQNRDCKNKRPISINLFVGGVPVSLLDKAGHLN